MVSETDFDRISDLFQQPNCIPGARLVQILRHETTACYYVFFREVGTRPLFCTPPAAAADYRRRGRLWLEGAHVLATQAVIWITLLTSIPLPVLASLYIEMPLHEGSRRVLTSLFWQSARYVEVSG